MLRHLSFFLLFASSAFAANGNGARSLTLPEAIRTALGSQPGLQAAGFAEQAAEHELRSAEALKLPRLTVQSVLKDSDHEKRYSGLGPVGNLLSDINDDAAAINGVVMEVPVYVGDRIAILPRMAKRKKEARQQMTRKAQQDLVLELTGLFLDVLIREKEVKMETLRLEVKEREVAAARGKAGADPLANQRVVALELELSEGRMKLSAVRTALEEARSRLVTLSGLPPATTLVLAPTFDMRELEGAPEEMIKIARAENPELRMLEIALLNNGEEIGLAASGEKPQVNFRADYFHHRPWRRPENNDEVWTVAVLSSWNLFDGGFVDQEKKKARKRTLQARADLAAGVQQVSLQIRQAYSNLAESRRLLDTLEKNIDLARGMLETVQEKFQVDIVSRADVQEARLNLMRAIVNRDRASAGALKTRAVLFRLMGRLEPSIFESAALQAAAASRGERG